MTAQNDVFGARATLESAKGTTIYYQLETLTRRGVAGLARLPFTVKILLENALRYAGGEHVNEDTVLSLAQLIALGSAGFQQLQGCTSWNGYRSPGEPGIPGTGCHDKRREW